MPRRPLFERTDDKIPARPDTTRPPFFGGLGRISEHLIYDIINVRKINAELIVGDFLFSTTMPTTGYFIPNFDFELGDNGFKFWKKLKDTTTPAEMVTGGAQFEGTWSVKATVDGAGDTGDWYTPVLRNTDDGTATNHASGDEIFFPVRGGDTVKFRVRMKVDNTGTATEPTAQVFIHEFDGDKTLITRTLIVGQAGTAWAESTNDFLTNSATRYIRVTLAAADAAPQAGHACYWDNIYVAVAIA